MTPIKISPNPEILENTAGEAAICNTLQWGEDKTWDIEFSFEGERLALTGELEPWLVLSLLPAMRSGLDIELSRPVSARLLQNLPMVQSIINTWNPSYQKIKITAPARDRAVYGVFPRRMTGCFFSGGIDSFYTVLNHLADIDVLIHMDNPWAGETGRARMNGKIAEAAHRLGKPLVIVKSNFRDFLDTYTGWDLSHGAALVTMAHLLAPLLSKVYLASTYTYANLQINGTHPLLDPLWSSEDLEIIHDGADTHKTKKVGAVAHNEIFLDTMRVCWENIENELNCGRCSKCLITMVLLGVEGVLDRCTTFAVPLDLEHLANFEFKVSRNILGISLKRLEAQQNDPALERALRQSLTTKPVDPQRQVIAALDAELAELHQKYEYYNQGLRFQMVDKLFHLLSKNKPVFRLSEAVGRLWKIIK